jgi:hypothetical protein
MGDTSGMCGPPTTLCGLIDCPVGTRDLLVAFGFPMVVSF